MKKIFFAAPIILLGLAISSCNDTRPTDPNSQNFNLIPTNSINTVDLNTMSSGNYDTWSVADNITFISQNTHDYSSWYIYVNDGGGNINQTNVGNMNRWNGIINAKGGDYDSLRISTVIYDNLNQWEFQIKTHGYTDNNQTLYIKTVQMDDFNDLRVSDAANTYCFSFKTKVRNDFNKWELKNYDNTSYTNEKQIYLVIVPIVITAAMYY